MKQRGLRAPALAGAADDAEGVILLPDQRDGDVDLAHAKPSLARVSSSPSGLWRASREERDLDGPSISWLAVP